MHRIFDLLISLVGLGFLSPLFFVVSIAIKLDSPGPIFYRGQRMGKGGKPFRILKFRTMNADAEERGGAVTHRGDSRVTRVGAFLRRTKLDELPQLVNVIRGEMALVGPRPEDPRYQKYYTTRERELLQVLPGITSIASLRYRREEEFLPPESWEKVYTESILPSKLDTELNYLGIRSFGQDLLILGATLFALLNDEARIDKLSEAITRWENFLGRHLSWLSLDVLLIASGYVLAFYIRFLVGGGDTASTFFKGAIIVTIHIGVNYLFGVYQRFWSYASARDSVILFFSSMTATLIVSILDLMLGPQMLALRGIWLGGFLAFVMMTAARYRRRLLAGVRQQLDDLIGFTSGAGARVLVVGAGEEGQLLVWQLQNHFQGNAYQVVGMIDDDRQKLGLRIHNVKVYGNRHQIPELAQSLHPDLIIVAIAPKRVRDPRELLALCRATSAQVKILPSLFEWLGHNGRTPGWEDVNDEELLQRSVREVDEVSCRRLLEGRVVMVTGAAGSIGSELCRQIVWYKPQRLVMLDINESGLHDLAVELWSQTKQVHLELILGDISNVPKMRNVFERIRPQIVFHSAAYKHVPILEAFPQEGVRVNIHGTRVVHSLAEEFGAERFVLISSDKAVNASNVLGMTKWIDELLVTLKRPGSTMLSTAVRFGNVLGSRGSVVPTFEKQIQMGGPITITHPEMTRYFLSIGEAISLVIQAAAMTEGGDRYALDMGMPLNILDLAHRMIRAHGLRPGQDIAIEFTGPRPGEKMNEELFSSTEIKCPTVHQSIFRIEQTVSLNLSQLDQQAEDLVASSLDGHSPDMIRSKLELWVQALQASARQPGPAPVARANDERSSPEEIPITIALPRVLRQAQP